ncbi:hypothetical protein L596_013946 [Steinernema carpocapsae]|uniref:Uncharacterized protein n=1 Tax=Steinernema carpocapsae TaxID=34508 RepID=A0A4U5NA25_STECR|nr:hypothetical protein L596_013946 [Steinernema carpocapsae]
MDHAKRHPLEAKNLDLIRSLITPKIFCFKRLHPVDIVHCFCAVRRLVFKDVMRSNRVNDSCIRNVQQQRQLVVQNTKLVKEILIISKAVRKAKLSGNYEEAEKLSKKRNSKFIEQTTDNLELCNFGNDYMSITQKDGCPKIGMRRAGTAMIVSSFRAVQAVRPTKHLAPSAKNDRT